MAVETFARRLETLWTIEFANSSKWKIGAPLHRQLGRLRDIVEGPDKALYLLTSNRDGRGNPAARDDRCYG